jgi:trans-aconitate 2-methyltransferase
VIGVDASADMIRRARETLGENADLICVDLLDLELDEPVDIVFSTSTLHWVKDHDRLTVRLHDALRPGGRLIAQCGGAGNAQDLLDAIAATTREPRFAEHLRGLEDPWYHPTAEAMERRLRAAGFDVERCESGERLVELPHPREWHRAVAVQLQLSKLPTELHEPFLNAVLDRRDDPAKVSFVRLDIDANRPAE